MKTNNLSIGYLGEAIAKEYLENQGYKIIEQNYKTKHAEIDLIAWDRRILVFIEVKAKSGERFGAPEEAINRRKINRLTRNALGYIVRNIGNGRDRSLQYRIDTVCIVFDKTNNPERISHYKNITF